MTTEPNLSTAEASVDTLRDFMLELTQFPFGAFGTWAAPEGLGAEVS